MRRKRAADLAAECPETLGRRLAAAFLYPFKGQGPYLLLGGTAFFALVRVFFFLPLLPGARVGMFVVPFASCYLVICLITIIRVNAYGESDPPNWPSGLDWGEWGITVFAVLGARLICFAPSALYFLYTGLRGTRFWLGVGLGLYLFPMYLLTVLLNEDLLSLNPLNVVLSIINTVIPYTKLVLFFLSLVLAYFVISNSFLLRIPFLGFLIQPFVFVYFLFVIARPLGIFYRRQKARLFGFD